MTTELTNYLPIVVLLCMAIVFGIVNIAGSWLLGPRVADQEKEDTYESGVNPFGSARKRFNVRFYVLAMTFLVFDVEFYYYMKWNI